MYVYISEQLIVNIKQEVVDLKQIKDRQLASLQECQNLLDKFDLTISEHERRRLDISEDLSMLNEKQEDLKTEKDDRLTKYQDAQHELQKKNDEISSEEEHSQRLEANCENLRNKLDELRVKQNLKGELRLNAFQKTLEREEIANLKNSIYVIRGQILDQKQFVMELKENCDKLVHNVDYRRIKLREILEEREDVNKNYNVVYDQLEMTERKILEIVDESAQYKYNKIEINVDIEKTKYSIARNEGLLLNTTYLVNEKENNSYKKIHHILHGRNKVYIIIF